MKLWGGNYESSPDAAFWEFNRSFPFDRRLIVEEVAASRAWVKALGRCGAISVAGGGDARPRARAGAGERAAGPALPRAGRRGRPQLRRGAARRDRRRARGPGAPRPQPQRADGHGAAPLRARRDRPAAGDRRRPRPRARRAGPRRRRRRDARLHAHARGRADHLRPLGGGARLGPGARPRASARRAGRAPTCCRSARARSPAPRCRSTARRWRATSASRPSPPPRSTP